MSRKAYMHQYYLKNLEKIKRYRETIKEKHREYCRDWGQKHKDDYGRREANTKRMQEWRKKNLVRYKEAMRQYTWKNKEIRSAYHKEYNKKIRYECLSYYGGNPPKCACCGETEIAFLALDHINGGGNKHRREVGRSITYWAFHNNFPKGLQVLCHNCNMAKHHLGTCPHKNNATPRPTK